MKHLVIAVIALMPGIASACDTGSPTSSRFYPQADDIPFYSKPDTGSPKVINETATRILETTHYRTLWRAMVLQGECELPGWVYGRIVEADGAPVEWGHGWVQSKLIKGDKSADQAAGLLWDPESDQHFSTEERSVVKAGALAVLKTRPDCGSVVTGSRSETARTGTYFVMCSPSSRPVFNVWFTVTPGKPETLQILPGKP